MYRCVSNRGVSSHNWLYGFILGVPPYWAYRLYHCVRERFIGRIGCIGAYESVSVCIGCVGAYESVWVTCKPRGAWMRILRTRYPASNGCVDVYRASDGTPPFFWNKKLPNFLGCIVYAFSGGHVLTTITHTAVYAHCSNNPCSVTTQE
jgi:hypothetical protein